MGSYASRASHAEQITADLMGCNVVARYDGREYALAVIEGASTGHRYVMVYKLWQERSSHNGALLNWYKPMDEFMGPYLDVDIRIPGVRAVFDACPESRWPTNVHPTMQQNARAWRRRNGVAEVA